MTADIERRTDPDGAHEGDLPRLRAELMSILTALWYEIDHHGGASAATFFTPECPGPPSLPARRDEPAPPRGRELREGRWLIRSRRIQNLFIGPTTELAVPHD